MPEAFNPRFAVARLLMKSRAASSARGFIVRLWVMALLLNALQLGFCVWALDASRQRFEDKAHLAAENLLNSLAQNMAFALKSQGPNQEPEQVLARRFASLPDLQGFLGARGYFAVFDDGFHPVARYPSSGPVIGEIRPSFDTPELRGMAASGQVSGFYRTPNGGIAGGVWKGIPGIERIFMFRRIEGSPLSLVLGLAASDYLRDWEREREKALGLSILIVLVSLLASVLIDRAWRKQAEAWRALQAEQRLNQTIIDSSPLAIYTRDREGLVMTWNPAAEKLFGWTAAEAVGQPLRSVQTERQQEEDLKLRLRVFQGESIFDIEIQRQKADGATLDMSATVAPMRDADGMVRGYLTIAADMTERRAAERRVEFLSYRDMLTGLPNRLLLQDRVAQAISQGQYPGQHPDPDRSKVALLYIDLDQFKTINDSLGHAAGDALLKEVANRLSDSLRACMREGRENDMVCRQGGDEFLIVLTDVDNEPGGREAVIGPVLREIRERLAAPMLVGGHELSTTASIGVAFYPDDGCDFETLLKKADTAMYRAKAAGRNQTLYFNEQMNVEAVDHLTSTSRTACGRPWRAANSNCTTSRSSICARATSSGPRPCCVGGIPSKACSRRAASLPRPKTAASSCPSGPGSCSRRAVRPWPGSASACRCSWPSISRRCSSATATCEGWWPRPCKAAASRPSGSNWN